MALNPKTVHKVESKQRMLAEINYDEISYKQFWIKYVYVYVCECVFCSSSNLRSHNMFDLLRNFYLPPPLSLTHTDAHTHTLTHFSNSLSTFSVVLSSAQALITIIFLHSFFLSKCFCFKKGRKRKEREGGRGGDRKRS